MSIPPEGTVLFASTERAPNHIESSVESLQRQVTELLRRVETLEATTVRSYNPGPMHEGFRTR